MTTIDLKKSDGERIAERRIVLSGGRHPLETWIIRSIVLMGLIFVATGFGLFAKNQAIISRGVPVEGRVIELLESIRRPSHGSSRPRKTWTPRFAYQWRGREQTYLSPLGSSFLYYPTEASARLVIIPETPATVLINDFRHRWLLPLVFSLSGLAILFAGCGARRLCKNSPACPLNQ